MIVAKFVLQLWGDREQVFLVVLVMPGINIKSPGESISLILFAELVPNRNRHRSRYLLRKGHCKTAFVKIYAPTRGSASPSQHPFTAGRGMGLQQACHLLRGKAIRCRQRDGFSHS